MRILTISSCMPFPPFGGGKLRTFHLLRGLARRHEIALFGFTFGEELTPPPFPVTTVPIPWQAPERYRRMASTDPAESEAACRELEDEAGEPWYASFYESPEMEDRLRAVEPFDFDLFLIEGSDMARFLPMLPSSVPRVLDFMDLCTRMLARSSDARDRQETRRMLRFEREAAGCCDLCLVTSEEEAHAARSLLGIDGIEVVPNGVDLDAFFPPVAPPSPGSILFTGSMDYPPNAEAAVYFAREILPSIRRRFPDASFHVVGSGGGPDVTGLASAAVTIHGGVPEIQPHLAAAEVVVVPIRNGGGTRLKVLEAAACGKAIVSTSLGAEGLHLVRGHDYLCADDPITFADSVLQILESSEVRRRLEQRARSASLRFDWNPILDRLDARLEEVAAGTRR